MMFGKAFFIWRQSTSLYIISIHFCYFNIDIKIEEMFYTSPKKNIEAFIESKNEEIKTLKQKILGSRVTYEDMQSAKSRLTQLKASHIGLQKEDHLDLKEVVKNSLQAVNDLVKKKNRLLEQLASSQKEAQQMGQMSHELVCKQQKAEQFYREVCTIKEKLAEKKDKKNRQILDLEEQIATRRKELTMEREIGDELETAKGQLKSKITKCTIDVSAVVEDNKRLRQAIRKQLDEITKLEHENENNQLRVQNLQLKVQKEEKHSQNLQHKIDAAQTFLQRFSEDKLIFLKQTQTQYNIDSLLKMCSESNERKQNEQRECLQQIRTLQRKIELYLVRKQQLQVQMTDKQQNLRELKEKGAELKSILNSIFHQDSSVLKLLADKKVYDSKKTIEVHLKQDPLELAATSDNFFMTGQVSI